MSKTIGSIPEPFHGKLMELVKQKNEQEERSNVSLGEILRDLYKFYTTNGGPLIDCAIQGK